MDELNNLNPNEPNNNQNGQNNSFQGPDPNVMNQNPYESQDPYSSLNPDYTANMNQNPYDGTDPYSNLNPDMPNMEYSPDQDVNQNQFNDINTVNNNNFDNNLNNVNSQEPVVDSNINDFDNQNVVNPILSQTLPTDNNYTNVANNMDEQNNNPVENNIPYDNNSFDDNSNMNYQDNNFVDPNMNYQNPDFNQTNNMNNNQSGDYNTEFVKTWMGSLYDKAHSSKFNWPAALFGGIYFLFRKMYLTGFLFILLTFLINTLLVFLMTKIGIVALALIAVINIAFVFIYGFSFYPLYRNFVRNKLNKLKQTITDNSQLLNIATQKGNTSAVAVIVYCLVAPIVTVIIFSLLVTAGLISFANGFMGNSNPPVQNETPEPQVNMQDLNFTENYIISYDSLVWFNDGNSNTLTKGDYSLSFAQTIPNINSTFGVDVTTPAGRSSLLSTLVSSLEAQATAANLSIDSSLSNFVMGTNAYYGYIDVVATDNISKYYFILLPEDDVLFQFVLTVNDTAIDYETNIEAINILTSVTKSEENGNDSPVENTIENNVSNEAVENNVTNVVGNDVANENTTVSNEVSNSTTNETTTQNTTNPENQVVNSNVVENSTLAEFLR